MKNICICLTALAMGINHAHAQEAPNFQGKTVNLIIGFAAGGGTDIYGRLVGSFLGKYLPGSPTVVVRNIPGADGTTAMNYLVEQVAPDGLTLTMAANSPADPANYRKPQAKFNPVEFGVIGGVVRGGDALLINKEARKRLSDKSMPPVMMGTLGGVPRSGMLMTAWGIKYLNWNAKWVVGYRGTNELILALERGEIDMTATQNLFLVKKLIDSGKFDILVQVGMVKAEKLVPRTEFGEAPVFETLIEGKIADPIARQAFDYWKEISVTDKWLALPPKTSEPYLKVYREAYAKLIVDPEFLERSRQISDDIQPLLSDEMEHLLRRLSRVSPEAIESNVFMLKQQGIAIE